MTDEAPDEVVGKIARLLRLAEGSSNPNEAAVAAAQATRLLEKYHLDRATVEEAEQTPDEPVDFDVPMWEGSRAPAWRNTLISRIAVAHGCRSIYQNGIYEKKQGKWLTLIGRHSDVAVVRYVYTYLTREIDRLTKRALQQGVVSGTDGAACFRFGAVEIVTEKILRARQEARRGHSSTAIVRVEQHDEKLSKFIEEKFPKLEAHPQQRIGSSWLARMAGREAGDSIRLNAGIGDGVEKKQMESK